MEIAGAAPRLPVRRTRWSARPSNNRRLTAGRAERHRRIAQAIERVYEADRRPVLAELSRHYVAATTLGEADRATYYRDAPATQAMQSNADEEAIIHLEAARALSAPGTPAHVQLLLDLGTCRTQSGFDPARDRRLPRRVRLRL